ncbi:MAG TPA: M20/M25/M40 family metallo-hydrolase, partial [Deltaproteobacteria bacterium]|nr:M20/M25/M40 family metallo-hydrolase [Deltaproteobacteria bacterium]
MNDLSLIDAEAARMGDEMVRLRRDFHAHPELGLKEKRTSGIVAGYLRGLGLEVETGIAGTGVVGLLAGGAPGMTLMLRSDMDALPVQEKGEAPYRSRTKNVMHACGHDGHMANLLGTAAVLFRFREWLKG